MAYLTQRLTAQNVRLDDPTGKTVIVGGGDALAVDDGYATYVERTWNNGVASVDGERTALVDIPAVVLPAGATNPQLGSTHVIYFRGYRVDPHGQHEFGRLWTPTMDSWWNLSGANNKFELSPDVATVAKTLNGTGRNWLEPAYNMPIHVDFLYNINSTDHSTCLVRMDYLAFDVTVNYDEAAPATPLSLSGEGTAAIEAYSVLQGNLRDTRRAFVG